MQQSLVCNISSRCLDAGPTCTTAARPPATSRPTLPTSRHFRSTRRACSHRPCTLPPRPRSGREVDHYFPHSYRRAPATPLEPTIATVPQPPSTATSGAPPALSTPPLVSPELEVALHPHQSRQPMPSSNCHGEPPAALRPKSKPPSPGATPRPFPRRPTTTGRTNFTGEPPASGGGGNFPPLLPRLGRNAE
jgi:hypothetical protein